MNIRSFDGVSWLESLEDASPNYAPVKCFSVLQFYRLKGRATTIIKENIVPIEDLKYCVFAKSDKRYYFYTFREYPLDVLYFKERDLQWDSFDTELNNLHNYVDDGNVHLLFNPTQVKDTTTMLQRLFKSRFNGEGKLTYRSWISLLEQSLQLEDYKDKCPNVIGFKTVCKQFNERINAIWESNIKK
jgi:hypothetical protein